MDNSYYKLLTFFYCYAIMYNKITNKYIFINSVRGYLINYFSPCYISIGVITGFAYSRAFSYHI